MPVSSNVRPHKRRQVIERYLAIAERVIALIRPKFYNRITWVVIAAGLLLVATPWWTELANAVATKYLAVTLPVSSAPVPWGVALVGMGLIYHLVAHYVSELVAQRSVSAARSIQSEHDKGILVSFFGVITEKELDSILQYIASQHAYSDAMADKLCRAADYLASPSMEFLDSSLKNSAGSFASALTDLSRFFGQHFFEHNSPPKGSLRFCMYPDMNVDRSRGVPTLEQQTRYDDFSDQLEQVVQQVEERYKEFRKAAKTRLAV